jgi:hypothetical protein
MQAQRTVRYAELLALLVAVVSLTLAFAIGRGVTRAIQEREEELLPAARPV